MNQKQASRTKIRSLDQDSTWEPYSHFFDSLPYGADKPLYTSGQDSLGQMSLETGFVLYGATGIVFEIASQTQQYVVVESILEVEPGWLRRIG